jgi:hypothetical protein
MHDAVLPSGSFFVNVSAHVPFVGAHSCVSVLHDEPEMQSALVSHAVLQIPFTSSQRRLPGQGFASGTSQVPSLVHTPRAWTTLPEQLDASPHFSEAPG